MLTYFAHVFRHSVSQVSSSDRISADDQGSCLLKCDAYTVSMSNCLFLLFLLTYCHPELTHVVYGIGASMLLFVQQGHLARFDNSHKFAFPL